MWNGKLWGWAQVTTPPFSANSPFTPEVVPLDERALVQTATPNEVRFSLPNKHLDLKETVRQSVSMELPRTENPTNPSPVEVTPFFHEPRSGGSKRLQKEAATTVPREAEVKTMRRNDWPDLVPNNFLDTWVLSNFPYPYNAYLVFAPVRLDWFLSRLN